MSMKFTGALREGYILHVTALNHDGHADERIFGRFPAGLIQRVLGDGYHDAIIVRKGGELMVGELRPPLARCTPLAYYEDAISEGRVRVDVLRPYDYDAVSGNWANHWFMTYSDGRKWYNLAAYALLVWKFLNDEMGWSADIRWADWCTESVMWAWLAGPAAADGCRLDRWGIPLPGELPPPGERLHDYWRRADDAETDPLRPTPLTTQHRWDEGRFVDCTPVCLVPGPEYVWAGKYREA